MQIVRSLVKFIGVAAAIWTVGVSGFIMFAPTQSQVSTHMTLPDGTMTRQEQHSSTSLLERQGLGRGVRVHPLATFSANHDCYYQSQSRLALQTRIIVDDGWYHAAV